MVVTLHCRMHWVIRGHADSHNTVYCIMYKIAFTKVSGRNGIAERKILPGSHILSEEPISCVLLDGNDLQSSCYGYSVREKAFLERIRHHAGSKFKGHLCILALRVVKKIASDSKANEDFMELCRNSRLETTKSSGLHEYATVLCELLRQDNVKLNSSLEFLVQIISRISTNAFSIVDEFLDEVGIGIYLKAACFNHSCTPNAIQVFDAKHRILIRALSTIERGEEITVSYIDLSRPTWWRRSELLKGYNFSCTCPRCESEDHLNGFRCPNQNCSGTCLPRLLEESLFRKWLEGKSDALVEQTTPHIHFSLPVPLHYIHGTNGQTEILTHLSIVCNQCGADRTIQQKAAIAQKVMEICNQYSALMKLSNQEGTDGNIESMITRCKQWQSLVDFMSTYLPLDNYCFCIVRSELRSLQEDTLLAVQRSQRDNLIARCSADLITNWRLLISCMQRCYPPQVSHPRLFVEHLRYSQYLLATLQPLLEDCQSPFSQRLQEALRPRSAKQLALEVYEFIPRMRRQKEILYHSGHAFHSQFESMSSEIVYIIDKHF